MTTDGPTAGGAAEREVRAQIAHLYRRVGFGATAAQVDAGVAAGYEATVEALLAPAPADPGALATPAPDLPLLVRPRADEDSREEFERFRRELGAQATRLALWWLDRMVQVASPVPEKLTLIWHDHWATSLGKVRSPTLMLAQNETLRRLGGGTSASSRGRWSATRRCWSGWTARATAAGRRTRTSPAS